MACLFLDGFAHYASANVYQKYTNQGGSVLIDPSPPPGRIGPALFMTFSNLTKTLTYQDHIIQGFAVYIESLGAQLLAWSNAGARDLFNLVLEPDGTLSMYAGNPSNVSFLIANASGTPLAQKTWYYLEVKFSLSGSTPITVTGELRINGTVVASGTKNSNVNQADTLLNLAKVNRFSYISGGNIWFKDAYVFNNAGGVNDDYAGDVTFVTVFPDGDVTTDWTSTGAASWDQINSNPPNPATYVQDGIPTEQDTFTWQNVPPLSGGIVAVQYNVLAQKTAEGTKTMQVFVGNGGSPEQLGPELFLSDLPVYFTFPMDVDPATGVAWTVPNFNAKEFGFQVVS